MERSGLLAGRWRWAPIPQYGLRRAPGGLQVEGSARGRGTSNPKEKARQTARALHQRAMGLAGWGDFLFTPGNDFLQAGDLPSFLFEGECRICAKSHTLQFPHEISVRQRPIDRPINCARAVRSGEPSLDKIVWHFTTLRPPMLGSV
ncbi:MAG: hypothetical protein A2034_02865 [Elusimicrobia bacterium GWA2_38_7]|nr:MAG: hypothetical protein A2034_02865 [Elusimicrobia bacterium GWA2_38_7]